MTPEQNKSAWVKWLAEFGADNFYDAFLSNAQGALSRCVYCGEEISLDIVEGGGVPDWGMDGDYGCSASPDTCDEGTGSHLPERVKVTK